MIPMDVWPLRRLAIKGQNSIWVNDLEEDTHFGDQGGTVLLQVTIWITEKDHIPVTQNTGSLLLFCAPEAAELVPLPTPLPIRGKDHVDFRTSVRAQGKSAPSVILEVIRMRREGKDRVGEYGQRCQSLGSWSRQ